MKFKFRAESRLKSKILLKSIEVTFYANVQLLKDWILKSIHPSMLYHDSLVQTNFKIPFPAIFRPRLG